MGILLIFFLILVVLSGSISPEGTIMSQETTFALNMYRALAASASGQNVFFSPLSISTCFALAHEGADGETLEQMKRVFHFPGDTETFRSSMRTMMASFAKGGDSVTLTMANKMYADEHFPVKAEYSKAVTEHLSAESELVKFSKDPEGSRQKINTWVAEKTQQKIKDLIPSGAITEMTAMVLANAIYFKGLWDSQFKKEHTQDREFHVSSSQTIKVPTMFQEMNVMMKDDSELAAKIIQIPYKGKEIAFTVILPNEVDGLAGVVEKLTPEKFSGQNGILKDLHSSKVHLFLPRFKIEYQSGLKAHLQKMGMGKIFSPQAELSRMHSASMPLYVSEAFHKAFIEVNEEGTEAAAATGMVMMFCSMPLPVPEIHVDHPFLYIISTRDASTLYFMGNYLVPA